MSDGIVQKVMRFFGLQSEPPPPKRQAPAREPPPPATRPVLVSNHGEQPIAQEKRETPPVHDTSQKTSIERTIAPPLVANDRGSPVPPANRAEATERSNGRNGMTKLSMKVNGRDVSGEAEGRTLLVHFIRDTLGLTGTHVGCDTSQCGACIVHVDGKAVKSCTMLAAQADGCEIVTIEGLASGGELHPVQAAFKEHHGLQCGFCTPGMIMASVDIIRRHGGKLDEKTVRHELEGNICRCTGYHNIVKAVLSAADATGEQRQAAE